MTDAEVVASWMEAKPSREETAVSDCGHSPERWWYWHDDYVTGAEILAHCPLTLDQLHEVEKRLSDAQWQHYAVLMFHCCCTEARTANPIEDLLTKNRRALLHATAEQKIRALAGVLRAKDAK